jgi:hypothetical protein
VVPWLLCPASILANLLYFVDVPKFRGSQKKLGNGRKKKNRDGNLISSFHHSRNPQQA